MLNKQDIILLIFFIKTCYYNEAPTVCGCITTHARRQARPPVPQETAIKPWEGVVASGKPPSSLGELPEPREAAIEGRVRRPLGAALDNHLQSPGGVVISSRAAFTS